MGGLAFVIVIGLYIAATIFLVHRIPVRWGKALAMVIAFLLPTADALWGRYVTLPELCQDAGLKVFKKASKEGGLMISSPSPEDYWIRTVGIAFVEGTPLNGRCARVTIVEGKPFLELDVAPKARYVLTRSERVSTQRGGNYIGAELRIEDRQSGEPMARYRGYRFDGGWAERFLGSFADSGSQGGDSCPPTADTLGILIPNAFN